MLLVPKIKQSDGLSLLEVVLAIAITTLSITALVILGNASVSSVDTSRNTAVADQYVRQALEQVRSSRDSLGWNNFIAIGGPALTKGGAAHWYSLSNGTLTLQSANGNTTTDPCTFAKSATYQIGSAPFYQVITLSIPDLGAQIDSGNEVLVRAVVCFAYQSSTIYRSDKAQTFLTNWR